MKRLMDLNYLILYNLWIMKHEGKIIKNNIIWPSMIWKKGIALRIARRRMLELPRNESRWKLREGIKSLMDPSCRTFMKNSVKQKDDQTEGKGSWMHKVNPCTDLDESLWWNSCKMLELREKKDELLEPRICMINHSRIRNWINSMKQE